MVQSHSSLIEGNYQCVELSTSRSLSSSSPQRVALEWQSHDRSKKRRVRVRRSARPIWQSDMTKVWACAAAGPDVPGERDRLRRISTVRQGVQP
jgi:hypothetical protein